MEARLHLDILPQPDDTTCGPTCLHAVYRYFGDDISLPQVIAETGTLDQGGGTLAVLLGCHALARGYDARIYTFNLTMFDPTWFTAPGVDVAERLRRQRDAKPDPKLAIATDGYVEFLRRGGELRQEDLTEALLLRYLDVRVPILTGLSATYLYRAPREVPPDDAADDIAGVPAGHFVVVAGCDRPKRSVLIADPDRHNPLGADQLYEVPIERVVCSILLGVLTYDGNLLVIRPRGDARIP
ncbi:MAG: hypothetical protein H6709_02650 [Kofleriaceae bacterium]|nr:hypothetical protein [Myxococcales bacterium]MCB9565492.1 hypothetical protein [Kofleriaceae bacterium]MCB9570966.1 hypothetical protein [Kofleriaceae bacterium]